MPLAYQSPHSIRSDCSAAARDTHAVLPSPAPRSQPVRYLEGVTTCVNYADFLDVTLSENLHHFNEFVVVTTPDDLATQNVCSKHGVICVETNVFSKDGAHFAAGKSHAINLGLAHLKQTEWLLHLDADIVLPDRFRAMLDKAALDLTCLHGADRLEVRSHDRWSQVQGDEGYARQYRYRFLLAAPELPLSARFVHDVHGFCPLGYFQLWHSSRRRQYPYNQGGREQTDVLFAAQWEPEDRRLLPTVLCYHLQSEPAPLGANWHGRRTKPFAP